MGQQESQSDLEEIEWLHAHVVQRAQGYEVGNLLRQVMNEVPLVEAILGTVLVGTTV